MEKKDARIVRLAEIGGLGRFLSRRDQTFDPCPLRRDIAIFRGEILLPSSVPLVEIRGEKRMTILGTGVAEHGVANACLMCSGAESVKTLIRYHLTSNILTAAHCCSDVEPPFSVIATHHVCSRLSGQDVEHPSPRV